VFLVTNWMRRASPEETLRILVTGRHYTVRAHWQGLQIRAALDSCVRGLCRWVEAIHSIRKCARQNLKTPIMDKLTNIHPSDMEIERYYTGAVMDQRELRALGIHLFGCPACVERAGTGRKAYGCGSGRTRTRGVRGGGTLPQTAFFKWTAVLMDGGAKNRFQTPAVAFRWVVRWTVGQKPVPKAE
jgi:hypothetical protein